MTWWGTRCQGRHCSRWIMKKLKQMKAQVSASPPAPLLSSNAILVEVLSLKILRIFATCGGAGRCAHSITGCYFCFAASFLISEECQFPLSPVHLIASVVALSQIKECQDPCMTKLRAHLKEVHSWTKDSICLSCQHPNISPQPSTTQPVLPPAFLRFIP
jgi:hypothetical protein